MTKNQEKLAKKHGTLEQFEKAIWNACNNLMITTHEAVTAINSYKQDWMLAGRT